MLKLFNLNSNLYKVNFHRRFLSGLGLWDKELSPDIKHQIELHWRDKIALKPYDERDRTREKYYLLSMFPYPSGSLHMGHVRVYTISDTLARYQAMNGKNVFHPIGWDSFGLPAENAAIERGVAPDEWTRNNIDHMKAQLKELGCSFEWNREITTSSPEYYHWTQELFLKLYDADLVYQKESLVNWDPVDQTVLADEQVDANGCSWRSGAKVEKKLLKQWFIQTTKFAQSLRMGLIDGGLEDWQDIIKMQENWIGECNGYNINFKTDNGKSDDSVTLWTAAPHFLDQVKFVAVKKTHLLARKEEVNFDGTTLKLKVQLINPVNDEILPVYVTEEIDFLHETDSFLGIPCDSENAAMFAQAHNIPFEEVYSNSYLALNRRYKFLTKVRELNAGGYPSSAKLRDWLISRQRYWGTPIPIIHCTKCGPVPVPRNQLPVELPRITKLSKTGISPLKEATDWLKTTCPKCHSPAQRETDTMDTFVDSSWYYLRYIDPTNKEAMFDSRKALQLTPVDLYIGGKEHAVLHLYYARFVSYFLRTLGLVRQSEPFKRLLVQGMVMGRTYRVKGTGRYLSEDQVEVTDLKKNKAVSKETGEPVVISWEKMSKSKHNGVDPTQMFREYGVDTTRLLVLADVSPTSHRHWNSSTFPGIINWQKRLWLTIKDFINHRSNPPTMIPDDKFKAEEDFLWDSRNYYVKGSSFNFVFTQQISVALSKQQGLTNSIRRSSPSVFCYSREFERALAAQIILLAPMAPHFASELWSGFVSAPNRLNTSGEIQWDRGVLEQKWPETDEDYEMELICQVNGHPNCGIKYKRRDLRNITIEEAVRVGLDRPEVQETLKVRTIYDVRLQLNDGFDGYINFLTKDHPPKKNTEAAEA